MIDERLIIDLLNQRFDDMNDRIDDLKRDVISMSQEQRREVEQLEIEMQELNKFRWTVLGAVGALSSGAVIALQKLFENIK